MSAGRLDLVDRHRLAAVFFRALDAEQATDRQQLLRLLVQRPRERAILLIRIAAHRVLQIGNRLRRPGVVFAAHAEGVFAADIQRRAIDRRVAKGIAMAAHGLFGDLGKADAFDAGMRCR